MKATVLCQYVFKRKEKRWGDMRERETENTTYTPGNNNVHEDQLHEAKPAALVGAISGGGCGRGGVGQAPVGAGMLTHAIDGRARFAIGFLCILIHGVWWLRIMSEYVLTAGGSGREAGRGRLHY